jgi:hypothetical protein
VRTRKEITMRTSLWEEHEQEDCEERSNRFAIWIEQFEPDAKRDWENMKEWGTEALVDITKEAKGLWKRCSVASQHTIATRAKKVGLSPTEYLIVFLARLSDMDAIEESKEMMEYVAQETEDLHG